MASSIQAAATLTGTGTDTVSTRQLRWAAAPVPAIGKSFGLEPTTSRLTCSINHLAQKCSHAAKMAAFAIAASALVVSGANAEGVPKRLTFEEIQSKTYMEVKGTGTANQCPTIDGGVDKFAFKPGKYYAKKVCLEPTSFTVKAEGVSKNAPPEFQKTKLMTRLTYTLDEVEGPFEVSQDGSIKFEEKDGIDYAAVTVQLPGGERVPFLFSIKQLVATGKPEQFGGEFLVPSYRGSSFLDPKGRGGSTGYDNAVALPAGGRGDEEESRIPIWDPRLLRMSRSRASGMPSSIPDSSFSFWKAVLQSPVFGEEARLQLHECILMSLFNMIISICIPNLLLQQ